MNASWRWRAPRLRQLLCPPNRPVLDPWVTREAARLTGLVVNVGAGEDLRQFGRRTIHVDAHAPHPTVRADFGAALPFGSAVFDGAICTEVLEHVPDDRALLAELARVLRPGAVLVITAPFMFRYHPDPADYRRYTPDGLAAALQRAGFHVDSSTGLGGRLLALILWLDGLHLIVRIPLRLLLVPFQPMLAWRARGSGQRWSPYAANAVARARRQSP
jgi:SAM-dependent methyltransferase